MRDGGIKMSIPVIFFHDGGHDYLRLAIESAKKYNENVHLIGKSNNSNMLDQWYSMDELNGHLFNKFKEKYIHMSSNTYEFELICFKRYFFVYEYLKIINADKFVMLDSDILTFSDYTNNNGIKEYDISASWLNNQKNYKWAACPCVFSATLDALEDFLKFIINMYSTEQNIEILKEKMEYHREHSIPGGICDMTLLYLWVTDNKTKQKYKIHNNAKVENNEVFDHNIQSADGYILNEYKYDKFLKLKKIIFEDNTPYFYLRDGKKVKALTLHFLGGAKTVMKSYNNNESYILKLLNRYRVRFLSSPKLGNNPIIKKINSFK